MVSPPQVSVVPEQVAVDEAASLDERWARAPNNTGFLAKCRSPPADRPPSGVAGT
jgi:hypothetical protein